MIARRALQDIRRALSRQAAVALLGPRQVGKTTLALEVARGGADSVQGGDRRAADQPGPPTPSSSPGPTPVYLDLQARSDRARLAHPRHFLRQFEDRLVVLDEIHRVPDLFPELRGLIDAGRRRGRRHGRFLILGSASVGLLQQAGETLAGRIEFVSLNPLDVLETARYVRAAVEDDLAAPRATVPSATLDATAPAPSDPTPLWVRGGFPDSFLAASDEDSLAFRQNFIRTYLERDLAEFVKTRMPAETLRRLWTMLAHSQGGTLNASMLAGSLGTSTRTVNRYVDTLTGLLLVRRLPPLMANVRKRLVKSPKVYIRDSGLVHALLGIGSFHALAGHPVCGVSWEGFVIDNLLGAAPTGSSASFYRTATGAEIDLVLDLPGGLGRWAIEVKRGLAPRLGKGFHAARTDVEPDRTFVVYGGSERYPLGDSVEAIGVTEMAEVLAGLVYSRASPV